MLPSELKSEYFSSYPPDAKRLAQEYIGTLRGLPLSFPSGLLRELIDYDYKFPAERKALESELANLARLSESERSEWLQGVIRIALSSKLEHFDWVNAPSQFLEQLSAHLWTTHQLDSFRTAATKYADYLSSAVAAEPPSIPRLGISVIGQSVAAFDGLLFRKLRPHGTYFSRVKPENGLSLLIAAV